MNYNEYQDKVGQFADYPAASVDGNKVRLLYPVLGLCEEVGELTEKMHKYLASGLSEDMVDGVVKELGDVCWFCQEVCTVMGWRLQDIAMMQPSSDVPEMDMHLFSDRIAGILAKAVRDNRGVVPDEKIADMKRCLLEVFIRTKTLSLSIGTDIEDVLQKNYIKLASRKERGVIHGSGDDR